eukprot:7492221-Lingulodinium_polyedra.AAC.1
MPRGSSYEVASVAQPNNGNDTPARGWFQGNGPGWSSVAFVWGLIAGSLSAVIIDARPNLRLHDISVAGPLGQ